ncbi:hypothetical protein [Actinomadura sp. CNU-125]|uniref:hypothetical protein n=1 Tax=Actinomadura sp. CNU-125 TaxID=1904961 RepID=UPI0021CCB211|nr:hypothetical protein [Actinomadura sp. CNU-125]
MRESAELNERTSSTIPNGSVSRTVSGPTRYRPRTSERTRYRSSRDPCGSIRSIRNRARPPSAYGIRSSTISSPLGSRDTFSSRRSIRDSRPTGSRVGDSRRAHASR